MDKAQIELLLGSEVERANKVRGAAETLQRQLDVIEQKIEVLKRLSQLNDQESSFQGPIAEALGLISDNRDQTPRPESQVSVESTESAGDKAAPGAPVRRQPSKVLGRRMMAQTIEYLNSPQRQIAPIRVVYNHLSAHDREAWEAIESEKSAEFRFRRMLRHHPDFHLERGSIFVRYEKYHLDASLLKRFPMPPITPRAINAFIVGRRFDRYSLAWRYQYDSGEGTPRREILFDDLVRQLKDPRLEHFGIRKSNKTYVHLATFELDGVNMVASYRDGAWTDDFDYQLPIVERI